MSRISFADLVATRVPLSAAEAVALTLSVADALGEPAGRALPPDHSIVLDSTGQVTLERAAGAPGAVAGSETTAGLASLTRRLLRLDDPNAGDRRQRVPGGLLVLLARALRQIDLDPQPPSEFREALERFGTPDPTTLAAVFWRAARMRMPAAPRPASVTPINLDAVSAAGVPSDERRHSMPAASDLRRYLREVERDLYEARTAVKASAPAVAAAARRRPARWRTTSTAAAATVGGAVAGTLLAFALVGSLERRAPEPGAASVPVTDAVAAAPVPADSPEPGAALAPAPVNASRTISPLLLSAAVGTDVFSPSFAPAGRTLLFHAGRQSAPLMRASISDAGEIAAVETLLDDGAANYHVTMSPDGTRIAFDSDRDGERGVYVANADGSHPTRISGDGYASVPSWSPEGDRVAFVKAEADRPAVWNVWIADIASGHLTRITSHRLGQPWGASWFPEGKRIAYSVEDRLMVADLESGLARGYRSPREKRLVRTPAVSPDGRRIVFQVQHDGVWILDLERARMRRVLEDATAEEFVWSPSGDAIAFHAQRGGSYGLWRLSLEGN
jgi:hypothetical protein